MTNLSMATLRAWERRYDFPSLERTIGGHRLYSEKDVLRLRWVKARIDEGMQTAQAIHALQHQEQTGQKIMTDFLYEDQAIIQTPPAMHLHAIQDKLFNVLMEKDLTRADQILSDALAVAAPDDIILDVIGPTIAQIGEAWENGRTSISIEHLATNYLRQRLIMWMLSGPPTRSMNPILMACAPEEWHDGSLLILGALLRRRRWPVAYLGQSMPLDDLAEFVRSVKPPLLLLVAMTESTAQKLIEWPDYMPDIAQKGSPIVGYGGRIFTLQPEWRLKMKGLYLGSSFREGLDTVERLL
jgi:DNA-binding transcriptional MerR regulator